MQATNFVRFHANDQQAGQARLRSKASATTSALFALSRRTASWTVRCAGTPLRTSTCSGVPASPSYTAYRMISSLRILHAPSSDNPTNLPVLVLNIDAKRFIFNAPEGLTRVLVQRGSRGAIKGLHGVFVPRVGSEECAGLPGLLMSLADQEKSHLSLYGPPVLSQYIATARAYARRGGFHLNVVESGLKRLQGPSTEKSESSDDFVLYKDKDVAIQSIPLYPTSFSLPQSNSQSRKHSSKKQKTGTDKDSIALEVYAPTQRVQQCISLMFSAKKPKGELISTGGGEVDEANDRPEREDHRSAWQTFGSSLNRLAPPALPPVRLSDASFGQAPALLFIVRGSTIRGKFDTQKAKLLGVPEGKTYSVLSAGQDVQISRPTDWLSWDDAKKQRWLIHSKTRKRASATMTSKESVDGFNEVEMAEVTIRSSDVLAPSKAGNSFAQVYLPSIDYLDDFLSARTQTYLQAAEPLHVLVHAVHPTVMRDGRYQAFMAKHTHTHHFVASRSFVPDRIGYPSAALATLRMSYLDEILFKVPQYSLTASESLARYDSGSGSIQACPLDVEISLHPQRAPQLIEDSSPDFLFAPGSAEAESLAAFQSSSIVDLQKQKAEMERWRRFLEISSQLQEDESKRNSLNMDQSDATTDISITTLGTGSALPSKYRNVSGTLLHLPKDAGYILLDCGEGTYGQLCRRFGKDIDEVIRNIRCIFISHIHGDHHMGMARLLSERLKLDVADKILYVLSTSYVRNYLLEVSDIEGLGICAPEKSAEAESGVIFLDIAHFKVSKDKTNGNGTSISPNAWAEKEEVNVLSHLDNLEHGVLPDVRIQSAEVDHRASHCYGIVLRGKGWSVAYSGDTRPSTNLIEACKGVDILIHEATFEDGQEEMATKKGHSTVGQAIEVGKKAGVRRILLTHFSQRYPKIPRIADTLAEEAIAGAEFASPAVSIAFDLMTLRPSDFGKTERYREALQVLFDEGGEDGDDGGNGGEGADSGRKTTQTSKKNSSAASKDPHARSNKETATKVSNVGGASEAAQQDADLTDNLEKVRWKRSQEQPQRKYVKEQEFAYVVTHIEAKAAATSSKSSLAMPARLAFSDRLDRVTEELHGLVGCSFHRDILQFDTVALPGRSPFVQAVIKVASAYAQHLVSALSSGVVLKVEGVTFVSNYVGTLNSHQLSTTKGLYATDSTKSSSSISSAPGRAWMEEFVVSKST